MRTHSQIIKDFGASALARQLPSAGVHVNQTTPQRWRDRNSIPAEYWPALVSLKVASLAELMAGTGQRRKSAATGQDAAA